MKNTSGVYISRLDHLRFFAAFMVFHWHFAIFNHLGHTDIPSFWPLSLLREGHTGVAFFMTISGYIFSRLSIGCAIDYRNFIRNRIYRVVPLLLLWTMLYFYLWKIDPAKLLMAIVFGLNPTVVPDNGWSVVVEFQCYFIFPFLIFFCNQYGTRFLIGLLVLSLLLKAGYWVQNGTVESLSYSTIFGRIAQFLCGMIVARLGMRFRGAWAYIAVVMSMLVLSYASHRFHALGGYFGETGDGQSARPLWIFWPAIEGVAYASLIVGYIALPVKIPVVIDRCLSKLGEVSYSLYLGHAFVLASTFGIVARWFGVSVTTYREELLLGTVVVLPLCLAAAFLTYHLVEKPFLSFRRSYLVRLDTDTASPGLTASKKLEA